MKLADDSREFVALLNSTGVEYIIVGGHAVAYHGYPRYTGDIDVFVRRSKSNAAKIVKVLEDFGFAALGVSAQTFLEPDTVVQLGRPPNRTRWRVTSRPGPPSHARAAQAAEPLDVVQTSSAERWSTVCQSEDARLSKARAEPLTTW